MANKSTVLPKVVTGRKRRLGRGYGSGRGGHTVGRGQKGQKARGRIGILFEGVKMKKSIIKRLPLRRGKGKFKGKDKPIVVNLEVLNMLPSGSVVNLESLVDFGIVDKNDVQTAGVKILGEGELKKRLTVAIPISNSAKKKVEKIGGKVINNKQKIINKEQ